MTSEYSFEALALKFQRSARRLGLCVVALSALTSVQAQDNPQQPASPDKVVGGYVVHQSIDLGGHIADHSGSDAMYNTLLNIESGPRILDQSLTLRAVDSSAAIVFDRLSTASYGYGGDPVVVSYLN